MGQDHRVSAHLATALEIDQEARAATVNARHLVVADLDRRVTGQLLAPGRTQRSGIDAALSEQAADAV